MMREMTAMQQHLPLGASIADVFMYAETLSDPSVARLVVELELVQAAARHSSDWEMFGGAVELQHSLTTYIMLQREHMSAAAREYIGTRNKSAMARLRAGTAMLLASARAATGAQTEHRYSVEIMYSLSRKLYVARSHEWTAVEGEGSTRAQALSNWQGIVAERVNELQLIGAELPKMRATKSSEQSDAD